MKDFWDQRYKDKEYAYGQEANDFLKENVNYLLNKGKILSIADGEGRNSVFLAKLGFDVEAVDYSTEAKKKALNLAKKHNVNVNYTIADLENYSFLENYYDAIIAIFAHTNKNLRQKILNNVKKSLKIGGVFLLEGYNKNQLANNSGGPKDIDMLFLDIELLEIFSDFQILKCQNISRDIFEGKYHQGKSDTLQFIAKKIK